MKAIKLAESDNFRHIICYLANTGGMKMRAARLVMDTLHVHPKEALQYVNDVQQFWREKTPSGAPWKPLPRSLLDTLKPTTP